MSDTPVEKHQFTQRIRCPIHGFIRFSEVEKKIINHPSFQRLRRIKQLALTHYLYPGATHTRFEHTLGVLEMSSKAFDVISMKKKELLAREFEKIDALREDSLENAKLLLRLFALFHDIGHTPFSHAGEILGINHEQESLEIIDNDFAEIINGNYCPGCLDLLKELLSEIDEKNQALQILQRIIKGQLDMDRADYLLRDSHCCGVEYGRYDHLRMIESMNAALDDQEMIDIAIDRGGYHSVEALLLARYQMNLQVYFHPIRRIYDFYIENFLTNWINHSGEIDVDHYKKMDDFSVYEYIRKYAEEVNDEEISPWAKRIHERDHHRLVFESVEHADYMDNKQVRKNYESLIEKNDEWDFYLDEKCQSSVHKLYVPGSDADGRDIDDLIVLDQKNDEQGKSIGLISKVLEKIPSKFKVYRIYAYPKNGRIETETNKSALKEMRDLCNSA